MEIEKNLVVSTANITQADSELLERISEENVAGLTVYSSEYWYLIYLSDILSTTLIKDAGFSEAFANLYKFALLHEEGFTFLKLDRDGVELEGFPTFEW